MRVIWFALGVLSLALGAIGAVLPVLPTTPFVILAAFAFSKSSPRVQRWLENSRVFGPVILNWREHGAIAPRYKITSMLMMGGVLTLSLVMGLKPVIIIVQATCITAAAAFILTRPNGKRDA
ncbi:MAG: YbaN family protein [Pseudomonadota bacterium]